MTLVEQVSTFQTNSFLLRMNREDNVNWFHGKISRETAEKLLKEGKYFRKIENKADIVDERTDHLVSRFRGRRWCFLSA